MFLYSAAKQSGETVRGELSAEDERALSRLLKAQGLLLIEAKTKGKTVGANFDIGELVSRVRPVGLLDKMFFTRNLAVMVSAGLTLTRSLDALAQETTNKKFKKILTSVNTSVTQGKTLAESLKLHESTFGTLFTNMIEVGETTGKLTLVLKLLANQMKKDYDLKKRVRGAMMYPAIIVTVLMGVGAMMMIYIIPTLSETIKSLGVSLPLSTRFIIGMSDFMVHYALWLLIGVGIFVTLIWRLLKTKRGKDAFGKIIIRVPLFGPIVKKFNCARFARTLAYLITSGVPIVRSLEITASVLGNPLFQEATKKAAEEIQKGKQLNAILANYPKIFQPLFIQMIKVGEETGKVSSLLLRLALFFEEDVNNTTKNLSTVIEPILMVVIGVIVGFFAVSMLQPIYSSLGNIG